MKKPENGKRYLIQSGEAPPAIAIYTPGGFVLENDYFTHRENDPDWTQHAVKWPHLRWMKVPRVPGHERGPA